MLRYIYAMPVEISLSERRLQQPIGVNQSARAHILIVLITGKSCRVHGSQERNEARFQSASMG